MPARNFLTYFLLLLLTCGSSLHAIQISEILPDNQGGLQDEDGQSPGWIELYNEQATAVNLTGWHLTDDPALPQKWTFPATSLPAGAFLVVFTSGKDRVISGSNLHTNFKLSTSGEYLALLDSANVVQAEFNPGFPKLRRNVSYALASLPMVTPLITAGASIRYHVPANGTLGTTWTHNTFNDATWATGAFPAGFDTKGDINSPWLKVDFDDRTASTPADTESGFTSFVINSTVSNTSVQTGSVSRTIGSYGVALANTGTDGYDDRLRTTPTNGGSFTQQNLLRDFVFSRDQTSTSGLDLTVSSLPASIPCRVTVWSFDSGSAGNHISDWSVNSVLLKDNYTFNGSTLPTTNATNSFTMDTTTTGSGGLVIGARRDTTSITFGVFLNAFQVAPLAYGGLITTNLTTPLRNVNSSVYLRNQFTVPNPAEVTTLRLRARYDDGFVAYVNGQQIASRNAPASLTWNSAATAVRNYAQATTVEEIMISVPPGLIVTGTNTLAVHGMNTTAGDTDFLMDFTLDAIGQTPVAPRYYDTPTPGAPNATSFAGIVSDTKFSIDRGFYSAPIAPAITCATPGAVIRYTVDGTVPTETNGTIYTAPVPISQTTNLRAVAFVPGLIPSNPDTHSYLYLSQIITQSKTPAGWPATWGTDAQVDLNDGTGTGIVPSDYEMDPNVVKNTIPGYSVSDALTSIPTFSITLPPGDFLGPNGMYQNPNPPLANRNLWERACSLEMISPDQSEPGFSENCILEIHGNSSRNPYRVQKHSFRVTFRGDVGNSSLNYPFYDGMATESFNKLVLRACFTDAWCLVSWTPDRYRPDDAVYMRDVWMKRSHAAMGYLSPTSRYCHVYVNGLYWGMYNICEHFNADFVSSHLGGLETDWEVISDFTDPDPSPTTGWKNMFTAANAGLSTPAAYDAIQQWLDPVSFADYYILHQYGEAEDWPHHNGCAYRNKLIPGSKFQWITWDQEIALNNHTINRVSVNAPNTTADRNPGRLLNKLRDNAEFRLLFADRAHKHLHNGGALDIGPSQLRWNNIAGEIDKAIVAESARWGDTADETPYGNIESRPGIPLKSVYTREADWLPNVALVPDVWIPDLHNLSNAYATINRFQAAGLYPLTAPPNFSKFGGVVAYGSTLTITATTGQIYYTTNGTDPRQAVTGTAVGTIYTTPVALSSTGTVKARVLNGAEWSALTEAFFIVGTPASATSLAVSEIFYHPADGSLDPEFVELINTASVPIDLTNVRFTEGIAYTFPNGTILNPGERIVVTGLQFTGKLDNNGEFLTLLDTNDAIIFRFRYNDAAPWPSEADGTGNSLVNITPGSDPSNAANWRASTNAGGSPGSSDATAYAGSLTLDSDQDGATNFFEYAMATQANNSSQFPTCGADISSGQFVVTFARAAASDDALIEPEVSEDLVTWTTPMVLISRTAVGSGVIVDQWSCPLPTGGRQYVRVRATKR